MKRAEEATADGPRKKPHLADNPNGPPRLENGAASFPPPHPSNAVSELDWIWQVRSAPAAALTATGLT